MLSRADNLLANVLIAALWIGIVSAAQAHHGPEKVIADLTERMETQGKTPVLLYRRATEYRILLDYEKAVKDLRAALELQPKFAGAWEMLAEVFLRQEKLKDSKEAAIEGVAISSGRERAACRMMLARALRASGEIRQALESCDAAFEDFEARDIDWYLIRGALQRTLGNHADRISGFERGYAKTRSTVLRIAALEAKIEGGRAEEVLPEIEEQLASSRLKSSWLLRRARANLALKREAFAREDLAAAIEELSTRIRPKRPDVTLVADRGLAHALLGNTDAAKADLKLARDNGATEWMLELLVEILES